MRSLAARTTMLAVLSVGLFLPAVIGPGSALSAQVEDPPVITDISAFDTMPTSVRITWTVDRPVTGQVEYGETERYGQFSALEPSFNWSTHIQHITGLRPGTTYHFRVMSVDESGQMVQSRDQTFSTPSLATPDPAAPPTIGRFGSAINADSLANAYVGGPFNQRVAYRFRATETSALESIRIYILGASERGYGAGTGGLLRISVQTDDGTRGHRPSGKMLAKTKVRRPSTGAGNTYSFVPAADLRAGDLYHIVFQNLDPNPQRNYVSVDGLYMFETLKAWQPRFDNVDWGQLTRRGTSQWSDSRGKGKGTITPIMALRYANGVEAGLGYMEVWSKSPKPISGARTVRERFYVGGVNRLVSKVSVRLSRLKGNSPLRVRLETSEGDLVASGKVPASSVGVSRARERGGSSWAQLEFKQPVTLEAGKAYHLVLSADADTKYSIHSVRTGVSYGYAPSTYFALGGAEFNNGSGWQSFQPPWRGPLDESDLQFFFD